MYSIKKLKTLAKIFTNSAAGKTNSKQFGTVVANSTRPQLILEELKHRDLIVVEGEEVTPFMQGLITNDITHLTDVTDNETNVRSLYTMFLNKGGRVLYDSIIYRTDDPKALLIECDAQISKELCRHLKTYRVRRNIKIELVNRLYKPWVAFRSDSDSVSLIEMPPTLNRKAILTVDPRLPELGFRILVSPEITHNDIGRENAPNIDFIESTTIRTSYWYRRYQYGVGEGIQDLPPTKCFPLESNADLLNGVCFQKGCYIGQELTARVHHTGVVRKRLMPLKLIAPYTSIGSTFVIQNQDGVNMGAVRGVCEDRALGLLRVEQALNASQLTIDDKLCHVQKPVWWPDVTSKKTVRESTK